METDKPRQGSVLSDGTLVFSVVIGGVKTAVSCDLLTTYLTCQKLEKKHNLSVSSRGVEPTNAFLQDLATEFGGWIAGCTPTIAWQVWCLIGKEFAEIKKNMSETPS